MNKFLKEFSKEIQLPRLTRMLRSKNTATSKAAKEIIQLWITVLKRMDKNKKKRK